MPKEVAIRNTSNAIGRHPLLKGTMLTNEVMHVLRKTPGITYPTIAMIVGAKPQSVNGALQRLKKAGLVISRSEQKGNRTVTTYFPVTENMTGVARDEVGLAVTVYVNDFGEYSAQVVVVNEMLTAKEDNPKPVATHKFHMSVPKPTEPPKTRQIFSDTFTPQSAAKEYKHDLDLTKDD